jgi:hypothetical protein
VGQRRDQVFYTEEEKKVSSDNVLMSLSRTDDVLGRKSFSGDYFSTSTETQTRFQLIISK